MNKFEELCNKIIEENMIAGGIASVTSYGDSPADSGGTGGSFGNVDSYAPGDARFPPFANTTPPKKKKKKKKKGKKKKEISELDVVKYNTDKEIPFQRRPQIGTM